ncbi:PRC-barrel domain-containing protein [Patescibacteria group bacterium]|nr:PRC-barrel domain-containing protein [Patescibacteria group bacterium]
MQIPTKKLLRLPVFTCSGEELGKISEFGVDCDTQEVGQYFVRSSHLIEELFSKELIINKNQVVSITEEKMIVEDLVGEEKLFAEKELRKNKAAPPVSL